MAPCAEAPHPVGYPVGGFYPSLASTFPAQFLPPTLLSVTFSFIARLNINVFISSTLESFSVNDKKPLLSESYSLAGRDGQQRAHPRAEVISIVFINPGRIDSSETMIPVKHVAKFMKRYLPKI